LDGLQRRQ
jgi:hypothetical protein